VGIGTHTITITATDAAGNTSTATTTFTVNGGGDLSFSLNVSPTTVDAGKNAKLEIAYSNSSANRISVRFTVRYSSPCGNAIIDDIGSLSINAGTDKSAYLPFHVPKDACTGLYTLTLEAYVEGVLVGTTTAQMTVTPETFGGRGRG
jgi:hypothetical protein